jgi:hypothetical protein
MISKQKAEYIRSLSDANGHIEPARLVEVARDPKNLLHDEIEWDVSKAAYKYQLEQARGLIRFVKLEVEIMHETVIAPFYVLDPLRPPRSKRYLEIEAAARDEDLALAVMEEECSRIAQAIRRATAAAKVLNLMEWLNGCLSNVSTLQTRSEKIAAQKAAAKKKRGGKGKRRPQRHEPPELRA